MKEPIGRIMDKIAKIYWEKLQSDLKQLDIDRSFYPLLLIEAGHGLTQQELACKLSCDKVQVVRIIDYLSANGYVERIQNQKDRRKYELTITEKARLWLPEIKKALAINSAIAFNGLTENQIDELYNLLAIIEKNIVSNKISSKK